MITAETYLTQIVPHRTEFGISINDCFSTPFVVDSENLHSLAQTKYGQADLWAVIAWYNNLRHLTLTKGQQLKLPSKRGAAFLYRMILRGLAERPKRRWWQIF